ncbi:MAG: class I SAM-dependent methyltransferase [Mesorhizobium sp.]
MSRLDSFIRRITAQRNVLNAVTAEIEGLDGPVLELGLGNGRTFDHLREKLHGRRIIAFDRVAAAHRLSMPEPDDLVLGDIRETATAMIGIGAALVHADIGTGYEEVDAQTLTWLPDLVAGLLAPHGVVASGLPLEHPALARQKLPPHVPRERYFVYRRLPLV